MEKTIYYFISDKDERIEFSSNEDAHEYALKFEGGSSLVISNTEIAKAIKDGFEDNYLSLMESCYTN